MKITKIIFIGKEIKMKKIILAFIISFFMIGVSHADNDVFITQAGATFTANINMDGNGNQMGNSTTVFTATGANQTFDIDQIGATNVIDGSFIGAGATDVEDLAISQTGNSNQATITVGTNAAADDVHITETTVGNSNNTTYNVGTAASVSDVDIDVVFNSGADSNTLIINENSTASTQTDKDTNVTVTGDSNTITITHLGAAHHNTTLTHVGASGTFVITQNGINASDVVLSTNGAGHSVTITSDD